MSLLRSCKFLASTSSFLSSTRNFSKSSFRQKALQNWKRPSIDELGVPKDAWRHVYDRNQSKFNTQLLIGTVVFGVSFSAYVYVLDPGMIIDPRTVKYSTILPIIKKPDEEALQILSVESEASVLEEEDKVALGTSELEVVEELEVVAAVASSDLVVEAVPAESSPSEDKAVSSEAESVPEPSKETNAKIAPLAPLPEEIPYLLIGAGTASFAAFRAIKARDPTAKILIIGDEERLPYMRPPLSKELWFISDDTAKRELKFKQWNGKERSLYYEPQAFYTPVDKLEEQKNGGISVATGRRVVRLDTEKQVAYLSDGAEIKYGKCLLATGGSPKTLPVLSNLPAAVEEKVTRFRKVEDFHNLDKVLQSSKSVTIFGGGFLGSELACALGQRSKLGLLEVNQAYQEAGNMAKVLPEYLSEWTTEKVKSEGVNVLPNSRIKGVKMTEGGRLEVELSGSKLETDHVVVAAGVEIDQALAAASGIQVDRSNGGYLVNDQFECSSNLWVAGDAAAFLDPQLGRRRVEHHDHAVVSGRLAGENMTGAAKSYTHQSMFWSDLGPEVGYEAIGIVDSKLPTVGVFAKATETDTPKAAVTKSNEADRSISEQMAETKVVETAAGKVEEGGDEYGKGVIFYLKENKIVGVLLWNVFNRMNIARRVLKEGRSYDDLTEVAKLFNIHAPE